MSYPQTINYGKLHPLAAGPYPVIRVSHLEGEDNTEGVIHKLTSPFAASKERCIQLGSQLIWDQWGRPVIRLLRESGFTRCHMSIGTSSGTGLLTSPNDKGEGRSPMFRTTIEGWTITPIGRERAAGLTSLGFVTPWRGESNSPTSWPIWIAMSILGYSTPTFPVPQLKVALILAKDAGEMDR